MKMILSTKKKCIVVTAFSDTQPGYLVYSYRLKALAEQYELTIISQGVITQTEVLLPDARYVSFARENGKKGWLSYLIRCFKYIKQHHADIVFLMHSSVSPLSLLIKHVPVLLYWNEHPSNLMKIDSKLPWYKNAISKFFKKTMFFGAKQATIVMPVGEDHEIDLLKRGVFPNKIKMIYLGVDDAFVDQIERVEHRQDNKIQYLFVGTVAETRGRDVMLEGLAKAVKSGCQNIHLTMVGADKDQLAYCQKRALELEISEHLTVLARVAGSEVPKLMAKFDMGVAIWEDKPWYRINPPTKLFEYLAAGLPVLASNICTHTRYIQSGDNGFIFDYSAQSFAETLIDVSNNKSQLIDMRLKAKESGRKYLWRDIKPVFLAEFNRQLQPRCVVVTSFDKNQPGFLDFAYRVKALAAHYNITVLSQNELDQIEFDCRMDKVVMGEASGKRGWLEYLWKCAQYIRKNKPDVVVLLHSATSPISFLISKTPTVLYWNEHPTNMIQESQSNAAIKNYIARLMQHFVYIGVRKSSLIMPIGEEHYEDLIAHGISKDKARLIYMGVKDSFVGCAKNSNENLHTVKLVYVGTISVPRGRDVMIEGVHQAVAMGCQNFHLTMVGANEEQLLYCKNKIAELSIENYLTVLPRVPGGEIPKHLAQADFGICLWEDKPWWRFNPPTKLFEYLVAGLPVLASNIRTHTRYIKNWDNGVIFDYEPGSFAESIKSVLENRSKIQLMKSQALLSGEHHLWSKIEPVFLDEVKKAHHYAA